MGRYKVEDRDTSEETLMSADGRNDARGPLKFNVQRDVPMLLYIRDATFVCNDQMCEAFVATGKERNRQCFRWRVQRLVEAAMVRVLPDVLPYKGRVYTITRYGLFVLESCGHGLTHLTSESERLPNERQVTHFLEINEVRRTFEKTKLLKKWYTDCELASLNYVLDQPYVKNYDAIAEIFMGGTTYRIGLEYERSLKTAARYKEIASSLEHEDQIDVVLYLSSTLKNVMTLAGEFRSPGIPMCFASSWLVKDKAFQSNVILRYGEMRDTCSLQFALESVVRAVK